MKSSELTFLEGFTDGRGVRNRKNGVPQKAFNWDKAAQIIRETLKDHPDLKAEAGLQGDWDYTGGIIFENNEPNSEDYTYLSSNWAIPTLILSWGGEEQQEIDCWLFEEDCRFDSGSKWDDESLKILKKSN